MSNFKGTKGKWVFSDDSVFSLDKAQKTPVEFICNNPEPYDRETRWEANSLLISKAPEMLEMLEKANELLRNYNEFTLSFEIEKLIKEATEL